MASSVSSSANHLKDWASCRLERFKCRSRCRRSFKAWAVLGLSECYCRISRNDKRGFFWTDPAAGSVVEFRDFVQEGCNLSEVKYLPFHPRRGS
eukprot:scaffold20398_cov184-Amphora_coffeaeformis.AAC.4